MMLLQRGMATSAGGFKSLQPKYLSLSCGASSESTAWDRTSGFSWLSRSSARLCRMAARQLQKLRAAAAEHPVPEEDGASSGSESPAPSASGPANAFDLLAAFEVGTTTTELLVGRGSSRRPDVCALFHNRRMTQSRQHKAPAAGQPWKTMNLCKKLVYHRQQHPAAVETVAPRNAGRRSPARLKQSLLPTSRGLMRLTGL